MSEISLNIRPTVSGIVVEPPTRKFGEPEIEISVFSDGIEISWREINAKHRSFARFLDDRQALEFAAQLSSRLLIDEWLDEIERAAARKGAA